MLKWVAIGLAIGLSACGGKSAAEICEITCQKYVECGKVMLTDLDSCKDNCNSAYGFSASCEQNTKTYFECIEGGSLSCKESSCKDSETAMKNCWQAVVTPPDAAMM